MADARNVSQKTIIEVKRVFTSLANQSLEYFDLLYQRNFLDWFAKRVTEFYSLDWNDILITLRSGMFFFNQGYGTRTNIIASSQYLTTEKAREIGEFFIERLAAFATTLPGSASLIRSLQLDGFDVDKAQLILVPLEGSVSAKQEEDTLTTLVKSSGVPNASVVLNHIEDAHSLYTQGKNHPSLGQSRNIVQVLLDGVSESTDANGKHPTKLPGGTKNRIIYLREVGFFTADEESAFHSGWGTLSAGTHPGVPEREQARIGLVLALEFGQLLLLKFANWKANAYQAFS